MSDIAWLFETVYEDEALWETFKILLETNGPEVINTALYSYFHSNQCSPESMEYKLIAKVLQQIEETVMLP